VTELAGVRLWAVILVGAVLTFAFRGSFVFLFSRVDELPDPLERALEYVPAAVLAALVVPAVVIQDGQFVGPLDERLAAAVGACVVAWITENILATIVAGMALFWVLGLI